MKFRFRDWQVYKDSRIFRKELNEVLTTFPKSETFVLISQTRRAMLPVILQIAEGSNRKTEKDKNLFIHRPLTSLDEIVACLDCALDDGYINPETHQKFFDKTGKFDKAVERIQ